MEGGNLNLMRFDGKDLVKGNSLVDCSHSIRIGESTCDRLWN
jgi:hypothetical protein